MYNVVIPDIRGPKTMLSNSVSLFSKRLIVVTVLARLAQLTVYFGYKRDKNKNNNNPLKTSSLIKIRDSIRTAR